MYSLVHLLSFIKPTIMKASIFSNFISVTVTWYLLVNFRYYLFFWTKCYNKLFWKTYIQCVENCMLQFFFNLANALNKCPPNFIFRPMFAKWHSSILTPSFSSYKYWILTPYLMKWTPIIIKVNFTNNIYCCYISKKLM